MGHAMVVVLPSAKYVRPKVAISRMRRSNRHSGHDEW